MAVPAQKVLHVAGYNSCGFFTRTLSILRSVAILFPTRLKIVEHAFPERRQYREWLIDGRFRHVFADTRAHTHVTSPVVWFARTDRRDISSEDVMDFLGGHDDTIEWCRTFLAPSQPPPPPPVAAADMIDDGHVTNHNYDYDWVVIGGGSGGMAAAKEAAQCGARVACLDFVTPSPHGTSWGLGGTCVNVGCIPKRLFHDAALLTESIQLDAAALGIHIGSSSEINNGDEIKNPDMNVRWEILRRHVQDYIRSLNFKYRVRLREKNVTYLNKLARFVDPHTIEARDKKGRTSTITSSRFLIATGGRPAPLDCPGGELAITSDDVFALETSPGKTLCIGASYISLECAGFLAGLGLDVTVAVRSILLRGFDRACSDRIDANMVAHGVNFRRGVTPAKLEKMENGQIKVTFSDGNDDVFDTVLVAIGRIADTDNLRLEKVGVKVNAKNKKVLGRFEQSTCPNVYAVGDVLDNTPELTPVAIQAGIMLARRLFGGEKAAMDYVNICTAVFTPIEYACVGLSEEDAIEKFGNDNLEVYHREFQPLEWSLSMDRSHNVAYTKVLVDNSDNEKVVGIHYVGPKAGDVLQGYGVAMKQGLTFKDLASTVGIHPTNAEEIVTVSITKRSGEDAAAGGC